MNVDETPLIYGLELQARALTAQIAESNEVRFFIATNSLKPNNQIHLVEYNEDQATLKAKIFAHPLGEIWKLNSSPYDPRQLLSCFSSQRSSQVVTQTALLNIPDNLENKLDNDEFISFENVEVLQTEEYGNDVRTTEFHPSDAHVLATVIDSKILIFNRTESKCRVVADVTIKNSPKFTSGKWSQHHQGNQFIVLHDCSIKSYDIRDSNRCAWIIEDAHGQLVRDLDCNPNKTCHIATAGDDGFMKIWDTRMTKESIFSRNDHYHWIWSIRFNTFHDQLLLTSSSDSKVLLTCAATVSSESGADDDLTSNSGGEMKKILPDGLLQTFDHHEDSVYCVEWSSVDPWIFASLSYDGRVIISKVPKQYKYQILF